MEIKALSRLSEVPPEAVAIVPYFAEEATEPSMLQEV